MTRLIIEGCHPLRGTFQVRGNSNAALALIAGSMLTDQPVVIDNFPATESIAQMLTTAHALGLQLIPHGEQRYTFCTAHIDSREIDQRPVGALTGSILFLASVLARRDRARLHIDVPISRYQPHLQAIRDLGGAIRITGDVIDLDLPRWTAQEIILTQTSVTATTLAAMLAASHGADTTIHNAASEPHVTDLLLMLTQMGAQIDGIGSNLLRIKGIPTSESFKGASVTVSPDHIEAASIAAIGALTDGRLIVSGIRRVDLQMILKVYERLGLRADLDGDTLVASAPRPFEISERDEEVDLAIETAPWPGFPSDLAAIATVVATQARGMVLIHEKLFNNRLLFVDKLNALGAQIVLCDPHRAIVIGPTPLRGDYIDNPDARTGLAMLAAALCAEGTTTIDNAEAFDLTFDHVIDRLIAVGAHITRDRS